MTNRERYITKRDEYDLMQTIRANDMVFCPIAIIGAPKPNCMISKDDFPQIDCDGCIQSWLNREEDKP